MAVRPMWNCSNAYILLSDSGQRRGERIELAWLGFDNAMLFQKCAFEIINIGISLAIISKMLEISLQHI